MTIKLVISLTRIEDDDFVRVRALSLLRGSSHGDLDQLVTRNVAQLRRHGTRNSAHCLFELLVHVDAVRDLVE